MNWTRKRPGVYECEAGMVLRFDDIPTPFRWWPMAYGEKGFTSFMNCTTLSDAKAAVEAHAKEAQGK